MNAIARSRVAWLVLAVAIVVLFQRHELFGTNAWSILVQAAAAALWIWARITFGRRSFHGSADPTAGGLVTTGPYRLIRHPVYASLLYFAWAGVATHPSAVSLISGLVATVAVLTRIAAEERLLIAQYPEYAAYAARTRRLVPFVL